ncbi:unnamed protein product [Oikopleura dioica]|uniref:ODAD1 central coiled coil region domain-containing protein n=1 Tax=Oikopleura dioica TaxID=34765 RepID=E4XGT8_OIKDI|nr:unnamed protein product [Oikopleura dioica]
MDGWTDFSEDDSEINNQELAKINRAIKQSAQRRQQFTIHFKNTIKKQNETIKFLSNEKNELTTHLSLAMSKKNLAEADINCDAIKEVITSKDIVESQIQKESNLMLSLDQKILQLSQDKLLLTKKLTDLSSDFASNARDEEVKVSVLKNRLHQQMLTYNSLLSSNKDKKHEIQHLRGEHVKFQNNFDRLENTIEHKRSLMAAMVDEGNLAFENQEDARQRAKALMDKNEKDILQHSLEYRELQRHLDHEEITDYFMDLKAQDKAAVAQEAVNKRAAIILKKNEAEAARKLAHFEQSFRRIYVAYGQLPIDELIAKLAKNESENFAAFGYVNESSKKIEKEIEAIGGLKYKIERIKSSADDSQMSAAVKMSELTSGNSKAEENLVELKKQLEEQSELFTRLFDAIAKLFERMGCNTLSIRRSLGDNEDINESNVLRAGQLKQTAF